MVVAFQIISSVQSFGIINQRKKTAIKLNVTELLGCSCSLSRTISVASCQHFRIHEIQKPVAIVATGFLTVLHILYYLDKFIYCVSKTITNVVYIYLDLQYAKKKWEARAKKVHFMSP